MTIISDAIYHGLIWKEIRLWLYPSRMNGTLNWNDIYNQIEMWTIGYYICKGCYIVCIYLWSIIRLFK